MFLRPAGGQQASSRPEDAAQKGKLVTQVDNQHLFPGAQVSVLAPVTETG